MIRNIFLYFFYCILRFSITFAKEWCITISQLGILKNSKFFDFYGLKKTSLCICPNILVRPKFDERYQSELTKIQAKVKQHLEAQRLLLENFLLFYPRFHPEIIKISKKCTNNNYTCFNEDINRPSPRHGHKYTKYKMCLSIMVVVICIKQHLSNIWSSIQEKV